MHSFKDFLTVDYMPGSDELMKYQAQKRKRGAHDSSGTVSEEDIDEVLGVSARIKKIILQNITNNIKKCC